MNWRPAKSWLRIATCDLHVAGEPLRVVLEGWPELPGRSLVQKRRYQEKHYDSLRRALLWEPRGHADMYGCVLTESEKSDSHLGVVFMHNSGYADMCGHGIIGLVTCLLETGMIETRGNCPSLRIDTPAGQVTARACRRSGRVREVSLENVPSFVSVLDRQLHVQGLGKIGIDIAFGGAFYALCRAEELGVSLIPENLRRLIDLGIRIKKAVAETVPIHHPLKPGPSQLFGTIIVGPALGPHHHSRNVCVFAEGEVDRSPTGTGISARAALLHSRGEIDLDQAFTVESIIGTTFQGRVKRVTKLGGHTAVIPEVTGSAFITGRHEFLAAPDDPLRYGFLLSRGAGLSIA